MHTLAVILSYLIPMYLAYKLGRSVKTGEIIVRSREMFLGQLRLRKQQLDSHMLTMAFGSGVIDHKITIIDRDQVVFKGTPQQLAELSQTYGGLIRHIEQVFPEPEPAA